MTISPHILQSMLKRNATAINELHELIESYKADAIDCKILSNESEYSEVAKGLLVRSDWIYKEVDKMTNTIKKLVAIQKELKAELRDGSKIISVDEFKTLQAKAAWQNYWAGHDDATYSLFKPQVGI